MSSKLEAFLINLSVVIMAPFTLVRLILFVIEHLIQLVALIIVTPLFLLCAEFGPFVHWSDITRLYKRIWRHLLDIEGVFYI